MKHSRKNLVNKPSLAKPYDSTRKLDIDEFISDIILEKDKEIDTETKTNPYHLPDNSKDFHVRNSFKNLNFNKKILIFLLDNECKYQNIIVYTPMKKTLFSLNYEAPWEDTNQIVCFNLADLTQKVKIKLNLSRNHELKLFKENLELMYTDSELLTDKEKVMYAKVNYKQKFPNVNNTLKRKFTRVLAKEIPSLSINFNKVEAALQISNIGEKSKSVKYKNTNSFLNTIKPQPKKNNFPLFDEEMKGSISSLDTILKYKFNKNLQNEKNNNVTETYDSNNTTVYNANENDLHYLHLNGTKFSNHKFLKGNTYYNKIGNTTSTKTHLKSNSLIDAFSFNSKIANNSLDLVKYVKSMKETEIERKKHLLRIKLDILKDDTKNLPSINSQIHKKNFHGLNNDTSRLKRTVVSKSTLLEIKVDDVKIEAEELPSKSIKTIEVKQSSIKEDNINIYVNISAKIEGFIKNKLDVILKDVITKEMFSVGYLYFKDTNDINIKSFQSEFLFYCYICEKNTINCSFGRFKTHDFFEMTKFYEYLTEIESSINQILENHLEFINYVKSSDSNNLFIDDYFFFRNLIFCKNIHLKRISFIDLLIKVLNIDSRVNFDHFLEFKSLFSYPKLEFKKKVTFIKKVVSIHQLDVNIENQLEFKRVFEIEERIFFVLKNNDLVDIHNVSKEKKNKIEKIFSNFSDYLMK